MDACLSDFALDDRELHGTAAPAAVAHLEGCQACQARLAERRKLADEFQRRWGAMTWDRIVAARPDARGVRLRRWFRFAGATALVTAAAALILFVGLPFGESARRVRGGDPVPKGRAVAQIICRRGGETFVVAPGDDVQPGDELRFRPIAGGAGGGYVQVGSVDGTGAYATFYPASDADVSVAMPAAGEALPGSVRLDAAPGPERVLVVISPTPLRVGEVRAAALAHAARGEPVDRIGTTPVTSAWLVFPKRVPTSAP